MYPLTMKVKGGEKKKRKDINTAHTELAWMASGRCPRGAGLTSGGRLTATSLGGGWFGRVAVRSVDNGQFHQLAFLKVILPIWL